MITGHDFSVGDRVYYLHTSTSGSQIKFAALVIGLELDGVAIRIGRYDPDRKEVKTFESVVSAELLQARSLNCSFEAELRQA